jgi:hypothetical protein
MTRRESGGTGPVAAAQPAELLTALPLVEAVLDAHAGVLGRDVTAYRHHVYRVVNLAVRFGRGDAAWFERLQIAAAFHDLGIWTAHTFDYLEPSVADATGFLAGTGRTAWTPAIAETIREHHKVTECRGPAAGLAEPFRRADWTDVSLGARRFGLPWADYRAILRSWPDEGFHWRLIQLTAGRWRRHPLSPLPMVRW